MRLSPKLAACALSLLLATYVSADTLTGTVTNGTLKKPAAGDQVILIKLASGMEEAARTKADAQGKFSFTLDDSGSPHLIRVVHQDVTYHRMAPPGTTSVDVEVFDVSKKVTGISVTADVMRMQAEGDQLAVIRLFAVNNASEPPKTQMNDHNFEFYLPEGAKIAQSMAKTANGQPINSDPVPQKERNRYAFNFPLRPGETQFQISYQVPYPGSAQIEPKTIYPLEHFVVMIPKTMQFTPSAGAQFQSMTDPQQSDATVQVAQRVDPSQPLGFKLAGTGAMSLSGTGGGSEASASGGGMSSRPGGGLGPPIDAPDPLQKYRWYIIGGFAAVLVAGALYVSSRQHGDAPAAVGRPAMADLDLPPSAPSVNVPSRQARAQASVQNAPQRATAPATSAQAPAASVAQTPAVSAAGGSMILSALKEELFELEVDHKQGRISQSEYEKAKAALDATLERALKRQARG